MDQIIVSKITQSDVSEIRALGLSTPELKINTEEEAAYYPEDMLREFVTSPHDIYLLAKVDNVLAGYFLGTFNPYLKEAYLIDIVVKPEFRRKGVGTLLYKEAFRILDVNGCRWAWSLVHEDNETMKTVLKKKVF